MEASQPIRSKKKERDKNVPELVGLVPEAPRLEDFAEVNTSTGSNPIEVERVNGSKNSNRKPSKLNHEINWVDTSRTSILGGEHQPSTSDSELLTPEVTESIPVPASFPEEIPLEAIDLPITDEIAKEIIEDIVEPCEEAISAPMPSAPVPCESGVFYSIESHEQQQKHQQLYPTLQTLDENCVTQTQGDKVTGILQAPCIASVEVVPQVRSYEVPTSQIESLYSNILLEDKDASIKDFLKTTKTSYDGFELYELLSSYLRACNQLAGCEKTLANLREKCTDYEKQLWTISYETVSQSAVCEDGNQVVATHKFHVSKFNHQVYTQLDRTLKEIKELVKDSYSLYTYSVELCKTQIKHFFHKSFKDINLQSFEVQGYYSEYPHVDIQNCAKLLRLCISTLFIFIRRPLIHPTFLRDCQQWVSDSVGLLLRIATLSDHGFILNHVLRCPPGLIAKVFACCVQIPTIPIPTSVSEYENSGFSHLNLDYALTVLSTILNPVSRRDDFLKQSDVGMKMQASPTESNHQWVVVDSDGEDDPEDLSFFKESDLVSLLQQIPIGFIFRRILHVYKSNGTDVYDVRIVSERNVLKLLAFTSQLVNTLGQGFISYYTDRYRQLIKMLGRLILHCVQYVTDHIECFSNDSENALRIEKENLIPVEYDLFLRGAVGVLFSGKNIGTLQFLAAVPYHLISTEMLWHIYCGLTKWNSFDKFNVMVSVDISSEFENDLISMNESDAFYLLTTMSNMAIAREGKEGDFVRVVTLHLFQIGFLSPLTRDSCSKTARDLMGNLTRKYPQIISVLLHTINLKMQVLEKFSLYLLKELAFDFWKPTDLDIKLLSHWLVSFPVHSIENQTGRFVIQSMNWDFDEMYELFLPYDIHYQVALIIMESHSKWERSPNILAEGMKQVNALTNRNQDSWAWDTLKRLHLHGFDRSNLGHTKLSGVLRTLPTFESHPELECIRKGIEAKDPLACLLALYLTSTGHSVPLLCSKGFDLVEIVLQSYRLEVVIHCLFLVTPLFVGSVDTLTSNEKFRSILMSLLAADMTYVKMAKNMITSAFPGDITKLFGEMISAQLNQSTRLGVTEKSIVRLWLECFTKLDNWNKDNNVLHLLDILAKFSFGNEECGPYFKKYFTNIYKDMPSTSQSGIASLFTWSTPMTTLLPSPSYSLMPYLLYYVLGIEMELENQTGFWRSLCIALNNPKISLDAAVKKSSNSAKFATSTNFLSIYRWAQMALDLPNSHELAFLVWQKFFLRYFHRVPNTKAVQYSCVASRFFEGIINSAFHNKLKKRLHDLFDFSRENLKSFERSSSLESASENPMILAELFSERIKLANAFVLWIEDSTLLQETLYLPALAPQFMPSLILGLMDGEEVPWSSFADFDAILTEDRNSARCYMNAMGRNSWFEKKRLRRFSTLQICMSNRVDDIQKRLNSYDKPLDPPPVPVFEDVVPSPTNEMFTDIRAMQSRLGSHFTELQTFSGSFSMQISQMMALNCAYWESLPELYSNNATEMLVNARCSGTKNWEGCSGAARVIFKYTEARINEGLGHQVHQNRTEYQHLMDEKGTQPPPTTVCVAAVFVEDFITNLVMYYRQCPERNENLRKSLKVGHELFYQAASLVNDETEFYPPTRQLISSLLEVLGREFVSVQPNECRRLVTTCIQNSKLIGSLAPHLNLATCPPSTLIDIYQDVIKIPKKDVDLAFVMLTKFDINSWLKNMKPMLSERSQLVAAVWKALTADGLTPEKDKMMVHDTYRSHLRYMLLYDFPQHYGEILTYLLQGTDQHCISACVWYDFCNALSRDDVRFYLGMDPFFRKREVKRFATEGCILSHQELIETAKLLAQHFTKDRMMHGLYGLYSKYRSYIEPLSCFLQMMSYSVVASSLKHSNGNLSQKIVEDVWPIIRDMHAPWILPYNQKFIQQNCAQWMQQMNFDSANVLQPWIGTDSPLALIIMNDFTDCMMFLVETLPGTSLMFSYLWNFYVENFAQAGVKDHVLGVVHNCFISIPWAAFWPSFADVEVMCRVVEKFLPVCHSFLSIVFAQISWLEWIDSLSPRLIGKAHAMLLNLTVRLGNDAVARESPTWVQVMERTETRINWTCISPSSLEPILNWFVMSIDPRVVLKLDLTHHMDKALLRLIKTACGYRSHEDIQQGSIVSSNLVDLNTKRYYFVRSYVRLIVSVSSKHKNVLVTNAKSFEEAIQDMLCDIVAVIHREGQSKDVFLPCLRELMGLMSNHALGTIARNAIIEWCRVNTNPPLNFLYAVIQLSYSIKVAPYVTSPLIEAAVGLCFQHTDANWKTILELISINPDELNNYFDIASKDGHYLVLYSLFLKRSTQLTSGGITTVTFLMDLVKNLKPKESNEESLPLVYSMLLKITISLYEVADQCSDEVIEKVVKKFLLSYAQHLTIVGDDKQGWGLLGALGIGKTSQLSIRGRLFAKSLGIFVLAQLPTNSPIRMKAVAEGHFLQLQPPEGSTTTSGIKPHPEVISRLEKLESLKINRQYADLIDCIDFAVGFIKEPANTLIHSDTFISKLNDYLFSARFLAE